jgi:Primase X
MTSPETTFNPASAIMPQADRDQVIDGINSILSMFEVIGQPAFPRNTMTGDYTGFFTVYDTSQLFDAFSRANFRECRISAYPPVSKDKLLIPNLLLLDLDYNSQLINNHGCLHADKVLKGQVNKILRNLQQIYKITNFMVMHTGNGRHILIPFLFDEPFENVKDLHDYLKFMNNHKHRKNPDNLISEEFLTFAKKYFSENKADQANYPNFASIFLRVPGSLNMKMKHGKVEIVKIEHPWNYEDIKSIPTFGDLHPDTDLFYDFMHHLALTAGNGFMKNKHQKVNSEKLGTQKAPRYRWIEVLHDTAISDCRKRVIWLILTRYAINVRKMSHNEAFHLDQTMGR